MTTVSVRRGHATIGAIISEVQQYLPPDTTDRPGYKHCHITYRLLANTYKRAEDSDAPEKVYKELRQLEIELRRRLANLESSKGVPAKMTALLNELKAALDDALAGGVDLDFLIQGMVDLLEDKPVGQSAPKTEPEPVLTVPKWKLEKVEAELAEAKEKIRRLNEENNSLVMANKKLESDRDLLAYMGKGKKGRPTSYA
ncbi:hypothetical protein C7974DRAFT_77877 [Boeremia exigua]|uniref:uncharacterized protein n=1 Tax=Boeremia exigua TaxID=749465 RepID=UPI001E8CD52E|nr:uncharacterized protein C7974DRAFT_77877 [Boeremia exigua]KAH6612440.1 hypothetical protein C7974DRAFT_77877 [Boeremia exigua]